MKFIITESQKDKAIFSYLDLLGLKQINTEDNVFFVKSEEDKYPQIKYNKKNGSCEIYYEIPHDIRTFFSLSNLTFQTIGKWVEDKIQMDVNRVSILQGNSFT